MPACRISWLLPAWAAVLGLSLLGTPMLRAQVSFYGPPPPSDFQQGAPTTDEGEESEPSAVALGIFAQKPFKLVLAVREGYDSNLFLTKDNTQSSFFTNVAGGLSYGFGTSRLKFTSFLGGGITYYYSRPGDKVDFNGVYSADATYLATPRLTLRLETSTLYLSQPDYSIEGASNQDNGDYIVSSTTLSGTYQWTPIISSVTKVGISTIYYTEEEVNDDLGYFTFTLAQSIQWLWKPKTTLVAEYRASPTIYYSADLNQFSNFFLLGFDQIFNPRFKWNLRGGAQVNFNENPVDGSSIYIGPYIESTLSYQYGPASNLFWNLRYGTEASGLTNVTQRQTFRTGLGVTHAITARLAASFGLNYQANYYDQAGVIDSYIENVVDAVIALRFQMNRFSAFEVGYQYVTSILPEEQGGGYDKSVAFVSANLAF